MEAKLDQLSAVLLQELFAQHLKEMGGDAPLNGLMVNGLPDETQANIAATVTSMASEFGFKSAEEARQFLSGARIDTSLKTVSLMVGVTENGVNTFFGVPFRSAPRP